MNLFSKTWINDFEWIELAIYSVLKHCQEPVNWYITTETLNRIALEEVIARARSHFKRNGDNFRTFDCELVWPECQNIHEGYMRQQWIKMNVHKLIGDHTAWNWDSDVIATNPFNTSTFMQNGKPVQWWDDMNMLIIGGYPVSRKQTMMDLFNNFSCREFMRCMPIPLHGKTLQEGAKTPLWKRSFDMCASNVRSFSEFNVIGEYCFQNHPDLFTWKNAHREGPTLAGEYGDKTKIVSQFWSWGGVNDGIRKLIMGKDA